MTGSTPELDPPKPDDSSESSESSSEEEESIVELTAEVIPLEELTELANASAKLANDAGLRGVDVQEKLTALETRGRSGSDSPNISSSSGPPRPVLQRAARFREVASSVSSREVPPASPGEVKAQALGRASELGTYFETNASSPATQQEIRSTAATYGTSVDEFFRSYFGDEGLRTPRQERVRNALRTGRVDPQTLSNALARFNRALGASPVDAAAAAAAAQDIMTAINRISEALKGAGLGLTDAAEATANLSGVADYVATQLHIAAEGGVIRSRGTVQRGTDLANRLTGISEAPSALRQQSVDAAQADLRQATSNANANKTQLEADQAALKTMADGDPGAPALRAKIAQEMADRARFASKVTTATSRVTEMQAQLRTVTDGMARVARSLERSPSDLAGLWPGAVRDAIRQLGKSGLPPDDVTDFVDRLQAAQGVLDLPSVAESLRTVTAGADLTDLIDRAWDQVRILGRLQEYVTHVLASDPGNAAVLDPVRVQLQLVLGGMAAYLAKLATLRFLA